MNLKLKTLVLSALTAAALNTHAQGSAPTDPQIAAIVVTANQSTLTPASWPGARGTRSRSRTLRS
jgi:hypothetical protein